MIMCLQVILIVTQLVQPYFYGRAIDTIIHNGSLETTLLMIGMSFVASILGSLVAWRKWLYEIANFDVDTSRYLIKRTAEKLFSFSVGQHRNEHSGLTQSVVTEGQSSLRDLLNIGIYQAIPIALSLPIATAAVMWQSLPVGLVVLVGFIMYTAVSIRTNRKFLSDIRKDRDIGQATHKRWAEATKNASVVSLQAAEVQTSRDLDHRFEKRYDFWKSVFSRYATARTFGTGIVIDFFQMATFGVAAVLAFNGSVRVGAVVTIMLWVNKAFGDISMLNRLQRNILDSSVRAMKYFALLDIESDVALPSNPIPASFIAGGITFEDVSFSYSGRRYIPKGKDTVLTEDAIPYPAIRNLSLTIEPGEHVAFVGPSGAGKSTAILLLLRGQDPDTGRILIDGVNLRQLDLAGFRRRVGVVEQQIVLFDDTLRYNISFGLGENRLLTDAELDRLAVITRMDQFRGRLTNGWDTWIGENGVKLSGGEKQRVAIARALARDPAILIFDEATSSLDTENEAFIKEAIDSASAGRTAITIAHRLSTIRNADKIVIFENKTIIGAGTHSELIQSNSMYRKLLAHQVEMV